MKIKKVFIILMAGSFAYSSPFEDISAEPELMPATDDLSFQLLEQLENSDINVGLQAVQTAGETENIYVLEQALEHPNLDIRLKAVQVAGETSL